MPHAIRQTKQLLLLMALLCVTLSGPVSAGSGMTLELAAGGQPGYVKLTLRNSSSKFVSVLRADTPFESTPSNDMFDIRLPVKDVPFVKRAQYIGRWVKRAPATAGDFVTLAPGGSLSATIDLQSLYAVPDSGDYRVRFRGRVLASLAAPAEAAARSRSHQGLSIVTNSEQRVSVTLQAGEGVARALPPRFNNNSCNVDQQTVLVEATSAAEGITGLALQGLRDLPEGQRASSPRYLRWFGTYDPERYNTVTRGYEAILSSLSGAELNYDCACSEAGVYAYVFASQLHDVYLCPAFFAAPVTGTDSRAGTLVHELSHFRELVGTDDHAYGQSAAAALASSNPTLAINNADSMEYFAENTPELPMAGDGTTLPPEENPEPAVQNPDAMVFTPVAVGTSVTGSLARSAADFYTTSGATLVILESGQGNVDLVVFNSSTFNDNTLVCSSRESEGPDLCELPADGTFYIGVFGVADTSSYSLSTDNTPIFDDTETSQFIPIPANSLTEGSVEATAFVALSAEAPADLTLTSAAGDADLYVFSNTALTRETEICRANSVNGVDRCSISQQGTVYIAVFGHTDASFELRHENQAGSLPPVVPATTEATPTAPAEPTATAAPTPDAEMPADDATPLGPAADSGDGSGGGGTVFWPTWLMMAFILCTRRRRTPNVARHAAAR